MKYCYPAVFTPDGDGYSVEFPDIENCYTCGDTMEDALEMAEDVLSMMLAGREDSKEPIPASTPIREVAARMTHL